MKEFPNVVVSRTFSKSYSLAGMRLGIAFGDSGLVSEMNKLKDSYNTDRVSQAAGLAALADQDHLRDSVARIRATRARVSSSLSSMGWRVLPSQANFILARPSRIPARELFRLLRDRGILVRYFPLPRVDEYLRITIGTDGEMDEFLAAVRACGA